MQTKTEIDILLKARAELSALGTAKTAVAGVQREIKQANEGFRNFAGLARNALGALGVGVSVGALTSGIKSVIDYGSKITDLATQTGTTTDAFQTLAIAAKDAGVEQDQLANVLSFLRKSMSEAAAGTGEAVKAFRALQLDARALSQLPIERAFEVVARAVANAEDKTTAYGYALDILGARNAPRLQEVLNRLAAEGFDKIAESTRNLRISPEQLKTLDDAGDKLARLAIRAKVLGAQGVQLAFETKDRIEGRSIAEKTLSGVSNPVVELILQMPRLIALVEKFTGAQKSAAEATADTANEAMRIAQYQADAAVSAQAYKEAQEFVSKHIAEQEKNRDAEAKATLSLNERAAKLGEQQRRFALDALLPQERALILERELAALIKEQGQVVGADNAAFAQRLGYEERILEIRRELDQLDPKLAGPLDDFFLKLDQASKTTTLFKEGTKDLDKAAKEMGWAFQSAFEDAILEGKKLSEVLKGLAQDILKIVLRKTITEPIGNWISTGVSAIFGGGKALGGPVSSGMAYVVGERGPELFVPGASGSIVPNDALTASPAGGGEGNIEIHHHYGEGVNRSELAAIIPQIVEASKAAVIDARRRRQPGFA